MPLLFLFASFLWTCPAGCRCSALHWWEGICINIYIHGDVAVITVGLGLWRLKQSLHWKYCNDDDTSAHIQTSYHDTVQSWTVWTPAVSWTFSVVYPIAIRLSGKCDLAGRLKDRKNTQTWWWKSTNVHTNKQKAWQWEKQTDCMRLNKKKKNKNFEIIAGNKMQLGTQSECQRDWESQLVI